MTKCNINIYDREVGVKQRTKPSFKINSEKIVKYSINRVVYLLLPTVTLLLNSREMDRNNRVHPLYPLTYQQNSHHSYDPSVLLKLCASQSCGVALCAVAS